MDPFFPGERGMSYDTILVEQQGAVTLVTLNRPQALNALNTQVLADLIAASRICRRSQPASS